MNLTKVKARLERELKSKSKDVRIDAIMYACFNLDDADWVLDKCKELIDNDVEVDVRNLAVICIGHTARLHGEINVAKVKPILTMVSKDPELAGNVQDAIDDIEIFTKEKIKL
ncbi:hypothetical protein [Pantoea sp. Cy-639]|uniref:hypothetical protein n=1 Tax=Pantoea sp. Cy-639 TaxID=2608360 RepID=UPI0014224B66|nr:hypothetical protein [Pantoea sp. Cy-639]NIF17191.1 hypothetical protein [Pantoea sp. Cy-639]